MDATTTPVIQKIKHLLALAAKAGTEAEAENASRHAQALMMKYRLSVAELESSMPESVAASIGEHNGPETAVKIAQWKSYLMNTICDINGCKLIISNILIKNGMRQQYNRIFRVIGSEADASLVSAFYCNLRDTVESLAKTHQPVGLARGEGKNWATSFKLGCTTRINERLKEGAASARQEAIVENKITALAVIDNRSDAVSTYVVKAYPKLRNVQASRPNIRHEAYSMGRAVGGMVSLSSKVLKS
jgi:hypothetical protein